MAHQGPAAYSKPWSVHCSCCNSASFSGSADEFERAVGSLLSWKRACFTDIALNRHRDLATNLVEIANQGQNAFLEAYSDLLEIGTKTNSMGRQGGIVSQLPSWFIL